MPPSEPHVQTTLLYAIGRDLECVLEVSLAHSLEINPNKSSVVVFGATGGNMPDVCLRMGSTVLPVKRVARSLGLCIDSELRFRDHISQCLKNAYFALKLIKPHRHSMSEKLKLSLCDTLVLSIFNHCDVIYGPCLDSCCIRRIQTLQNSCLRMVYGVRKRDHISNRLEQAGWLNMYNRRTLHMLSFFYKIVKSKTPPYLHDRLTYRTDVHSLNIRRKTLLTVPQHRRQIFRRSFSYNAASVLGSFGVVGLEQSLNAFKKRQKKYLFDRQVLS